MIPRRFGAEPRPEFPSKRGLVPSTGSFDPFAAVNECIGDLAPIDWHQQKCRTIEVIAYRPTVDGLRHKFSLFKEWQLQLNN
jgi:hypothetical protein